jgi:hypothetical protein
MLESYEDIRKRIPEPPKWFDSNGVPRYDEPSPGLSPNIYADEVLFYEIACQACGKVFLVEENWSRFSVSEITRGIENPSLAERVRRRRIHYGDPPRHDEDGCLSGATMNCIDGKTVQFWTRSPGCEWSRLPELEGLELEAPHAD